ncbi:MAG: hypothetical protein PHT91_00815 [Candidatus Nanoarchaeia archaeon]|nr:hypothetical protein [Candidatus Nanoarchaeia archaeon]MDD5054032.1 hypothetical protein [Candidatus Nanoarchaeia archaeon]MDD5499401.1 hypothetical protein [Candidatus Nanoarchaeia archaeon]
MQISEWLINFNAFKKNTDELVWHNTLESFALSLISVFIPIFLLEINFSLNQVFLYYFIYFISFAFFSFFVHKFLIIGFQKLLLFRPISLIIFFSWLFSLNFFPGTLNFLALYGGLVSAFYWVVFHCFYSVKTDDGNSINRVRDLFFIPKVATLFSPIIGAVVISHFSFSVLFIIVSIILFLSLFPIKGIKNFELDMDFDLKYLYSKTFLKFFFGFAVEGAYYAVIFILFPLFVYLNIGKMLDIGFLSFFVSFAGIISPILVSKICKANTSVFIKIFSILEGLLFLFVLFIDSIVSVFLISFVISIFANFWLVPFASRFYSQIKQRDAKDALELVTLREIILNVSRAAFFGLILLFGDFGIVFIINSLSRLLFLFF